ncbi:MAG: hypothetical protein KJ041_02990 [Gammaproteobacteria bacterium]|nr:hypothetical protein [Gammaproteobacteria bacterium]
MDRPYAATVLRQDGVSLTGLAAGAALLPALTVHLCYGISAFGGLIPLCIPYVEGCTSVSSSGRYGAAYFLFKAGMLPSAVLIGAFWWLCRHWLLALGDRDCMPVRSMVTIGIVAAVFLVLYSVFLGSRGEFYNLMRRFGVTVYFGGSYLAQLLLISRLVKLREGGNRLPAGLLKALMALALALLATGLASIPVMHLMPVDWRPDKHRFQNIVEWNFCALLIANHALLAWGWRHSQFRAGFRTIASPRPP